MKKLIFSLTFLLISVFSVQAQTEKRLNTGNVSMFVCEDYNSETGDITRLFTGFKSKGTEVLTAVVLIQNFEPNVVHQLEVKIINPAKEDILEGQKHSFTHDNNVQTHTHIEEITATFDIDGVYQMQTWVDDKLVQYLNFNIGDHIPQNFGKGNVAMVVCDSYDDQNYNINGWYTGIKKPKETKLSLLLRFQDFPLNEVNKAIVKLITPAGQDLLSKKEITFTYGRGTHMYFHTSNINAGFSKSGVYQFQVEVNGKTVQYLNFNVGAD